MTGPDPVAAATWFIERGYKAFPVWGVDDSLVCQCPKGKTCDNPGKHPATVRGFKDATTDVERVKTFLANAGTHNYGLVPPPHIGVIDVDGAGLEKWAALQLTLGPLPITLTTVTPNGFHYHFDFGDDPIPTHLHGFVVRSVEKGYIIGVGSRHASGAYYDLLRPPKPIAKLPERWKVESQPKTPPGSVGAPATTITIGEGYVLPERVSAGQPRYDAIRDYVAHLYNRGVSKDERWALVLNVLSPRFDEPLTEDEVLSRWKRADNEEELQRSLGEPAYARAAAAPMPIAPVGAVVPQPERFRLVESLTYVSLAEPSPQANDWRIEGLMRMKGLMVLAAPEGLGKSWMRTELAIRLATGHGALFDVYPVRGKHAVLLLDEENGEDIEFEREDDILDALGLKRTDVGEYMRMSFGMTDLETKEGRIAFETRIEMARPDVVIIDTGGVTVGEEFGPTFARNMRYVRSVSEKFGIVILFIVHLVKPLRETKERAAAMRDGRALTDVMGHWGRHADCVMQASEAEGGRVRLSVRKRWGTSEALLAQDNSLWKAVKVVTETKSRVAAMARLRMLGALKHLGVATSGQVGEWLAKDAAGPISPAALSRHFKALTEDGSVIRDTEGGWSLTPSGEAALSALAKDGVTLVVPRADE